MLDFLKPRHLRYRSMEEWRECENIRSLHYPENPKLEAKLNRQRDELRKHLWKRHLSRLTREERKELKRGTHPSQSPRHIERARLIFEEFNARMSLLPYVAEVTMVTRHMNLTTFRVKLSHDVGWRVWQEQIPPFYRGFEVIIAVAPNPKPLLTRETAEKLIPNGMSEAEVYSRLGTNAAVSLGNNGKKSLAYLFHFPPAPPKVDPRIDAITVIISNGVVVDRRFSPDGKH